MIYLLLSILFSTSLFVIFKLFRKYDIDNLKAIVVNYGIAFLLGWFASDVKIPLDQIIYKDWLVGAFCLGLLFILIFVLMAKTAQNNGVSVASVASKMSVVIPVTFGILMYKESAHFLKIIGILCALIAVYLVSVKNEKTSFKDSILLPLFVFLGSGIIDTTIKYIEVNYVPSDEVSIFSSTLFGFAGLFGGFYLLFRGFGAIGNFGIKNVIGGALLGIPNYFSILFLIRALQTNGFESSSLFTLNNVGIVLLSSILSILLFHEKFSFKNGLGVLLAVISIVIMALV